MPPKQLKITNFVRVEASKRVRESTNEAEKAALLSTVADTKWSEVLKPIIENPKHQKLFDFLKAQYDESKEIFPPHKLILSAFNYTPWESLKVVLLGQDPYHDDGQAHGLSFSVLPGVKIPPSLRNMYKELESDIPGFKSPSHGCLVDWAKQGVLLLNASLTVEAHQANSHAKAGWLGITDEIISEISAKQDKIVFLLWGGFAQTKSKLIDSQKHRVICTAHPSPLSATKWFGCKCFSQCNAYLASVGKTPITWALSESPSL